MSNEFFPYPFKLDMQHIIKSVTELSLSLAIKCINLCNEKYTFLKTEFLEYRHRIHRVKKKFFNGPLAMSWGNSLVLHQNKKLRTEL